MTTFQTFLAAFKPTPEQRELLVRFLVEMLEAAATPEPLPLAPAPEAPVEPTRALVVDTAYKLPAPPPAPPLRKRDLDAEGWRPIDHRPEDDPPTLGHPRKP